MALAKVGVRLTRVALPFADEVFAITGEHATLQRGENRRAPQRSDGEATVDRMSSNPPQLVPYKARYRNQRARLSSWGQAGVSAFPELVVRSGLRRELGYQCPL